eukprot:3168950-Pyramimonas_sp.AAC.1
MHDDVCAASPGVEGQKGLRLQFNSRQSTLVYHSAHGISNIPPNIRRIFPATRLPHALPTVDSGAWCAGASSGLRKP